MQCCVKTRHEDGPGFLREDDKNWGGKHRMKPNTWPKIERTREGALQLDVSLYPKRICKIK